MQLDFVERALLGGAGIALIAGPLGCIIIWRRMANFGDALGHSMLLGVAFALLLNLNLYLGLFAMTLILASLLALLSQQKKIAQDTLLSVLAQSVLALGLILASTLKGVRIDLLEYLYGDILAIDLSDLIWIYAVVLIAGLLLYLIWRPLLSATIHEELAEVEGVNVRLMRWIFIIAMALVFAIAMKLVGILLITAMLVIPASTARSFSKTPEQMVFYASFMGIVSVILGVVFSQHLDWPTGPSIVVASFVMLLGTLVKEKILK